MIVALLLWSFCARATYAATDASRKTRTGLAHPNSSDLTLLGIALGRANLASVRKTLGPAKVWSSGDAAASEGKVCYFTQEPQQVIIVFASNTEMAGPPENNVTEIQVIRSKQYANLSKCRPITATSAEVSTQSGLKLGLSEQDVRRILGTPARATDVKWDYLKRFDERIPGPHGSEHLVVSLWVTLRFDSGSVQSLSIGRIESSP
jgi:hypothetical protein